MWPEQKEHLVSAAQAPRQASLQRGKKCPRCNEERTPSGESLEMLAGRGRLKMGKETEGREKREKGVRGGEAVVNVKIVISLERTGHLEQSRHLK